MDGLSGMAVKDSSSSVFKYVDVPASPDSYFTGDYEALYRGKSTPVVIDNGSCTCKAGWAGEESPRLVFRNALAKTRVKKGDSDPIAIGNDITHVEAVRSTMKSQFDRNIVVNFSYQEQVLDYTFSHLGFGGDSSVSHPIVMTEPVCNLACSRSQMSELLFECYGVPSVAYGIDALFSAHHNFGIGKGTDALVISSGHQTTYVLPILDGQLDSTHCKRINLGGMQTVGYLQRLLQLKYPDLQTQITLSCAQEILHHHSYVALDYREELQEWAPPTQRTDYRIIQLPFNQSAVGSTLADASREAKDRQRREKARQQLLKLNKQKREDKIATLLRELNQLFALRSQQESCDFEEYQLLLDEAGHESEESLACSIEALEGQLEVEQEKLATLERNLSRDISQQKQESEEVVSEEWLQSLKERRKELLESKRQREMKRAELGKRRSAASQNRMRIISSLGAEVAVKKGKQSHEDTFGMDDSDWNVYRAIDKHAEDSDSEKEDMELGEIVKVLEKHDPSYIRGSSLITSGAVDMATYYQLVLGVERFRAPEITFQPPMVGVDQSGLSETMEFVLQYYPPEVQQRLVQNVFVTGGNTLHQNFSQRLEYDLRCMRPFQSHFTLSTADDPVLDAWRGGGTWASSNLHTFTTKQEYLERGADFMKHHNMSNTP